MNTVLFCVIAVALLAPIINRKKSASLITMLILMVGLITRYPQTCVNAAKDGLELWLFVVVPSLLPFFIINDMLVALKVPEVVSDLLTPVARKLFRTSGYGAYAFIMSIFSGYPAGARITAELIVDERITAREGQRILTFSSTSGPLFIIGVVGTMMLGSPTAGYILLICHITGAILNGVMFRILYRKEENTIRSAKMVKLKEHNAKTASVIFAEATMKSLYTCGFIGGYVIMFSVINALLDQIKFFYILEQIITHLTSISQQSAYVISAMVEASLEISNGSKILSQINIDYDSKMILLSMVLAFSGLSILGQVGGILHGTKINFRLYVLSKATHGLLSSLLCWLILKMGIGYDTVSTYGYIGDTSQQFQSLEQKSCLMLLTVMLLLLMCTGIRRMQRKS